MSDPIMLPEMCLTHQKLLVEKAEVPESGPWRSLLIVAQIALFQAATTDEKVYKEIGGDVKNITKIGCIACRKGPQFWDVIDTYKANGLAGVKALGEKWVEESAVKQL